MSTTTYYQALSYIQRLTTDDQLCLLEELAAIVRNQVLSHARECILDLQGLGKEIWLDVDAQEYVDQERASWDG